VLLLCGRLRELVAAGELIPDELDRIPVTRPWLEARLVELQDEFGENWGRTMARMALDALVDRVVGLMSAWGLLERVGRADEFRILPLAARWEATYDDNASSGSDDGSEEHDMDGQP
jgi:hypothetical protein